MLEQRITLMSAHNQSLTLTAMKTLPCPYIWEVDWFGWKPSHSYHTGVWPWLPLPPFFLQPVDKVALCFRLLNPSVILTFCGQKYRHPVQKNKINPVKWEDKNIKEERGRRQRERKKGRKSNHFIHFYSQEALLLEVENIKENTLSIRCDLQSYGV